MPPLISGPCSDSDLKTNQEDTSTLSMGPFFVGLPVGDDNNSLLFFELLLDLTGVGELPPDNELMPLSEAAVPPLPSPRNGELLRVVGKLLAVNVLVECE